MDKTDLSRLEVLKTRLRARLERTREGEYFRSVLPILRSSKVRGRRVNIPQVASAIRATAHMPGLGDRIDWSKVPNGNRFFWERREERDSQVCTALQKLALPDERVVVVWYPEAAGLLLKAAEVCRLASSLLDVAPNVWVVPVQSAEWLIEVDHFDHEVCFGRTVLPIA